MLRSATVEPVVDQLDDACLLTDVAAGFDLRKQTKKHKIRRYLGRLTEEHGEVTFVAHTGPRSTRASTASSPCTTGAGTSSTSRCRA